MKASHPHQPSHHSIAKTLVSTIVFDDLSHSTKKTLKFKPFNDKYEAMWLLGWMRQFVGWILENLMRVKYDSLTALSLPRPPTLTPTLTSSSLHTPIHGHPSTPTLHPWQPNISGPLPPATHTHTFKATLQPKLRRQITTQDRLFFSPTSSTLTTISNNFFIDAQN